MATTSHRGAAYGAWLLLAIALASHGERIAATIPGAKLVILPAVHLSNVEYPADFLGTVIDFLTTP